MHCTHVCLCHGGYKDKPDMYLVFRKLWLSWRYKPCIYLGHGLGQTLGDGEGQRGLECCSPWGREESDMTGQLNNNNKPSIQINPTRGRPRRDTEITTKFSRGNTSLCLRHEPSLWFPLNNHKEASWRRQDFWAELWRTEKMEESAHSIVNNEADFTNDNI